MSLHGPPIRTQIHNGAAASLIEVVNFYDQRFGMQLTKEQKWALVAFLDAL